MSGEVDRRSVVSPSQARELLTTVTYVGRSRGPMLAAMFACMYFGGLRPAEAAGLRQKDCRLPERGLGAADPGEDQATERQRLHRLWAGACHSGSTRACTHRKRPRKRDMAWT